MLHINYKIITKAIFLKLHSILLVIVWSEQKKIVHDQYILDNFLVVWEGMEWAHRSQQDMFFLQIIFEKVYDKIEFFFILVMLFVLGF